MYTSKQRAHVSPCACLFPWNGHRTKPINKESPRAARPSQSAVVVVAFARSGFLPLRFSPSLPPKRFLSFVTVVALRRTRSLTSPYFRRCRRRRSPFVVVIDPSYFPLCRRRRSPAVVVIDTTQNIHRRRRRRRLSSLVVVDTNKFNHVYGYVCRPRTTRG